MREITCAQITEALEQAVLNANTLLPPDVFQALQDARSRESFPRARQFLDIILENSAIAELEKMALCQDTGMVVADLKIGQDVRITNGDLNEAIHLGVRNGYSKGYFRNSVVRDPLDRVNTGDNSPAIIHCHLSPGEHFRLTVFPKGAGSENMGQVAMLKPAQGMAGVKEFVLQVVRNAGANACPPLIVGVGIGGNMEKVALLSKQALLRPVNVRHKRPDLAALEMDLLEKVNLLGIGPQGMGGDTTALAVNVETYPTHIACLPVAVCLGCHVTRRVAVEL